MIEARERPRDGTQGACIYGTGACAPLANVGKCKCILNKIIKIQVESYLTLKYMNPCGSGPEQRVSQQKEHSDTVCAAAKGTATCCMLPQRVRRHAACHCEGHSNVLRAAVRGTAIQYMQP